jgi:hypothetical protein
MRGPGRTQLRCFSLLLALTTSMAVSACQGSDDDHQHATVGRVGYDVPVGWQRTDLGARESVWTPPENARKESVTITTAELDPALAQAGPSALEDLLLRAQGTLHGAKVSAAEEVATSHGLRGFRVAIDFAPLGDARPHYTRIHTLLTDGKTVVHVLYTAATPDPDSQALKMAVDTAHVEG